MVWYKYCSRSGLKGVEINACWIEAMICANPVDKAYIKKRIYVGLVNYLVRVGYRGCCLARLQDPTGPAPHLVNQD